jgi:hypothetical protein
MPPTVQLHAESPTNLSRALGETPSGDNLPASLAGQDGWSEQTFDQNRQEVLVCTNPARISSFFDSLLI